MKFKHLVATCVVVCVMALVTQTPVCAASFWTDNSTAWFVKPNWMGSSLISSYAQVPVINQANDQPRFRFDRWPGPVSVLAAGLANAVKTDLADSFGRLADSGVDGSVGLVVMPCAKRGQRYGERQRFGTWTTGPAWSTYKVPLSVWALGNTPGARTEGLVRRAIRNSDNDAGRWLRIMLGGQPRASARYTEQLRRYWPKTPVFSSGLNGFGPANWSLNAQAAYMAGLSQATGLAASRVLSEMGKITPDQSWGLGAVKWGQRNVYFKGGWAGHGEAGWASGQPGGMSRQMGLIVSATGRCWAVAMASDNPRGVEAASRDLTKMAKWLRKHLAEFEYGKAPKRGPLW